MTDHLGAPWIDIQPAQMPGWKEEHPEGRVIDVREAEELIAFPFPDAEHLPLSAISSWLHDFEAPDGVLVVCAKGARSSRVCEFLYAKGHTNLANLAGGVTAWRLG